MARRHERGLGVGQGDGVAARLRRQRGRDLERGERVAGVAVGPVDEMRQGVVGDGQVLLAESAGVVGEGAQHQGAEVGGGERLEAEQGGARQQRAGEGEVGVLGGRPHEDEQALLHVGQQGVLLGAVEAVHLVEEQDGALAVLTGPGRGPLGDLPDVLHPGGHRGERFERLAGGAGHEAGDGRLAGAGRSPEDHRRQAVGLDQDAQRTAGAEQVLLADDVVEGARPQAGGQRGAALQALRHRGAEEVVGHRSIVGVGHPPEIFPGGCQPPGRPLRMVNVAVALEDRRTALGGDGATDEMSVTPISIDLVFEDAFEDLYGRAYGVAYQLLGRRTEAEDVAQEALARAFVHWRKIRGYAEAWVVRVAGNLAIDTWRKRRHVDEHRSTDDTPGIDGSVAPRRPRCGSTCTGRWPSSRSASEKSSCCGSSPICRRPTCARALGCSVGSVKQHASRGLATLRTSMGTADEEIL